ncbi:hypothetical protein BV22DRAFT_1191633, partial [Leucogyrophana mollusca]
MTTMNCQWGYLLNDIDVIAHGKANGIKDDDPNILIHSIKSVLYAARVGPEGCLRKVRTAKGREFWAIAFASTFDDKLPRTPPPPKVYAKLKEILGKEGEPGWYYSAY